MTREEAASMIKNDMRLHHDYLSGEYRKALSMAISALEQPTIEERKTGKWIEVEDFYNRIRGRCSACGWESHMYEDDVVGMDYCPNCGARMEKEGEEHI